MNKKQSVILGHFYCNRPTNTFRLSHVNFFQNIVFMRLSS